jgi:hypothetical protein
MALASSVLMFAGSPQAFLGVVSAQEGLFLFINILPAYGRYALSEHGRTLIELFSLWHGFLQNLGFAFYEAKT